MTKANEKKGRGGVRAGSGRPKLLSEEQRWLVGLWCEEQWRLLISEDTKNQIAAKPKLSAFDKRRAELIARAKNLRPPRLKSVASREEYRKKARENLIAGIEKARDAIFGKRYIRYRIKISRPYSQRKLIAQRAADEIFEAERAGRKFRLSVRTVEQCWKEYRALERWLSAQNLD